MKLSLENLFFFSPFFLLQHKGHYQQKQDKNYLQYNNLVEVNTDNFNYYACWKVIISIKHEASSAADFKLMVSAFLTHLISVYIFWIFFVYISRLRAQISSYINDFPKKST